MSQSRCVSSALGLVIVMVGVLAGSNHPCLAQFGGGAGGLAAASAIELTSPVASRVYQRGTDGKAEIPIAIADSQNGAELVDATATSPAAQVRGTKVVDGKLVGVPVGGPYTITVRFKVKSSTEISKPASREPPILGGPIQKEKITGTIEVLKVVSPVFVGDLWVLAGQSNMEGLGDLIDVTPPHPRVSLLGMDGKWGQAEEPLHWLIDSPDPVHSSDPKTRAARSAQAHKNRRKGAGLGLPFAVALVDATGVPVGLVACAHGGTSMAQWSPAQKEKGGASLYGSMLRQLKLAGGKVRGVLWYQGESDANGEASKVYAKVFHDFIGSVRSDLGQPDLPFYFVQIGRFISGADPKGWNAVQDAERVLAERIPNTAVISVVDLELDDAIHVGTQGLKRAGQRLARIAQRELFGQIGATTPTFERVTKGPNNTLVVKFKGVNMGQARSPGMGSLAGDAQGGFPSGGGMGMGSLGGAMAGPGMRGAIASLADLTGVGLKPERHIAGFSIRKDDGTPLPLIFESVVGNAKDTVILKLARQVPDKSFLWYGNGLDPYCNLRDSADMGVPVFGPIALDELSADSPAGGPEAAAAQPIKVLLITGDNVGAHNWQQTSKALEELLEKGGRISVDVTASPSKDLTDDNLARYDVLVLNYKETPNGPPESRWSDSNKEAFLKAVRDGKGLAAYHFASSAFTKPNWDEFEKAVAGGWRSQGFHGPKHVFTVKKADVKHPISDGLPARFEHVIDELYQNSVMVPGSVVLATAYSDPNKPRGTGKDEPVIWVNTYGKGRVYENVLGHDLEAMADPNYQDWMRRGVIWAATGKVD
jgi:type 1 glutamine amidotransferase